MLFELFGDRSLTETPTRFPVCSAEQPDETLTKFAETWKTRKDDVEYKRAQDLSTPNPDKRLSIQIYALRRQQQRAAKLAAYVTENQQNWQWLTQPEKGGSIANEIVQLKALE